MGKKLDALLGKGFKASKFKATVNLAISRISVLKNQRQARLAIARSDVLEFLKLANHDRALLRVEQVIKEQKMWDVFDMLEGYCHLLIERVNLIEQDKVCSDELKEAVASLIYASTRCGEFPELQEIRIIFTARYGKEFVARCVELRNNCGVSPQIVQKLSTRMPSLENKKNVLKEIALENNIELPIEENPTDTPVKNSVNLQKPEDQLTGVSNPGQRWPILPDDIERVEDLSDSVKARRKYKDVADAAQAAFESAAYAAAAARAAVELSRSDTLDSDDSNSPNLRLRKVAAVFEPMKSKLQTDEKFENKSGEELKRSPSVSSSSDSSHGDIEDVKMSLDEDMLAKLMGRDIVFDESDDEKDVTTPLSKPNVLGSEVKDSVIGGSSKTLEYSSDKHFPLTWKRRAKVEAGHEDPKLQFEGAIRTEVTENPNISKRPFSVRTRKIYGR